MKLTIFGASSKTGKLLVNKALSRGHHVTAFVRDEAKLPITHPNLKIKCGDALTPADVEAAIEGSDAVVSTLGPRGKPPVMVAESTGNLIQAMKNHGAKRLILVSVAGIPVAQDRRGRNVIDSLLKRFLKDVFADREKQLALLEASDLDWIAVRVPRLTNDAATGSVEAFFGSPSPGMKVTRADLAAFMLDQLSNDRWLRQAPIVRN